MHIGLIKLILPNAKIIDARREPMACCFSGFKQLFGDGQEFTYGLDSIARYYRAYERLMCHWDEVLPGFVLRIQHEDVVNDLESQVYRIFVDYHLNSLVSIFTKLKGRSKLQVQSKLDNLYIAQDLSSGKTMNLTSGN